ncbi:tRNA (adenosine(37)-N6)-threonylcarbamoyltransferase complex dimerization subunit type 1 TsaB [Ornithinimicrobium cryptoxanthini]|uniref:tRNA (adenosine(37)-N6)-threonylcarbamoyltransferase complex dimerization subunit type 1 TsaB n=1 Tax=Ornithinimicrobium cryptoxanthini TaxID=2934161 RepID=UPI002118664F|nr:tRNA (adenosine(37)-N6)-threonylcarbamoyltransferase complex dimerization subunit type 1 TsaB [Ornithinimicrobium cryptoxanthini]
MLLALDTATGSIGAAVLADGAVLAEVTHQDSRRHGELLAPAIEEALAGAGASMRDLTGIVVGVGPGPFTGLRVGIVTGLVMARVRGIPVHGVCSLDALAEQAVEEQVVDETFLVATDARRKEVYWAVYAVHHGRPVRTDGPGVAHAADLPDSVRCLPAVGRGPLLYDSLRHAGGPVDASPGYLGRVAHRALSGGTDQTGADGILLPPEPLYLRHPDAAVPGPAKLVP